MLSFPEISKRKSEKETEIEHEREGLERGKEASAMVELGEGS